LTCVLELLTQFVFADTISAVQASDSLLTLSFRTVRIVSCGTSDRMMIEKVNSARRCDHRELILLVLTALGAVSFGTKVLSSSPEALPLPVITTFAGHCLLQWRTICMTQIRRTRKSLWPVICRRGESYTLHSFRPYHWRIFRSHSVPRSSGALYTHGAVKDCSYIL
jgi:hypothetical protein